MWRSTLAWLIVVWWLSPASAIAQYWVNPYFGKNKVRYDRFEWQVYATDHFDIYYYPEIEPHLERVASSAESAYLHVSASLRHDLGFRVPIIVYKTHSEFEQTNLFPGFLPEGVAAFAEPVRDRIVLPIDEPADRLQGLVTHELTHVFEFDMIPRWLLHHPVPLWIDEGLADYERGLWDPLDLMMIRDAVLTDRIPALDWLDDFSGLSSPRLGYNLGHAFFELIDERLGPRGIYTFLRLMRRWVVGGMMDDDPYARAFDVSDGEVQVLFTAYLRERFHPFRDKQRTEAFARLPGRRERERAHLLDLYSAVPSPSGDLLAAVTGNHQDRELDLVLISTRDGRVIRNLTGGLNQSHGFEYLSISSRFTEVPWIAWAPDDDLIAYLVRREKHRSLVLHDPMTGRVRRRIDLEELDEAESPSFAPDGSAVALSAMQDGVRDIFRLDLTSGALTNLTQDPLADYAPAWLPDGGALIYAARISGFEKLFRYDLATGQKTQLTFGTHHDSAPAVAPDGRTVYVASTAIDPTTSVAPEVAANGEIYNIWSLDLSTGALRQYTDLATGGFTPVITRGRGGEPRLSFVGYQEGAWDLYSFEPTRMLAELETTDFGTAAAQIDFQPNVRHVLVPGNTRRKKLFESLSFDDMAPLSLGVTSNGTFLGGTQLALSDILNDQVISVTAVSVSNFRTMAGTWINLANRLQYAVQGFSYSSFFYANPYALYDPTYAAAGFYDPANAVAVRTIRGGTFWGIYPFDRYRRVELGAGFYHYHDGFLNPDAANVDAVLAGRSGGRQRLNQGNLYSLSAALVQETTVFREFGPLAGNTFRVAYDFAPAIAESLSRQTLDLDARHYQRLTAASLLALRLRAFRSWGAAPDYFYFGGYGDMRGYEYLEFSGNQGFFADAELRFPLIDLARTPIGLIGPIRGVLFLNVGGAAWDGRSFKPIGWDGFRPRLVDARGSYGMGLSFFLAGYPVHLDWTRRTLLDDRSSDERFGRDWRRGTLKLWVGLDF